MSAQAVPAAKPGNQFFDVLPDDAVLSVFEYLKGENGSLSVRGEAGDRAVIATAAVCRNWRDNAALTTERQEAATRLHQRANLQGVHREMRLLNEYPPEMVQVFRNSHAPIFQLPVLDLGDRMGGTGYIDFIQPEDMPQPVMRFRDRYGRPGVALKIHASREIVLRTRLDRLRDLAVGLRDVLRRRDLSSILPYARVMTRIVRRLFREAGHDTVLAPFKRYITPESRQWSYGWGSSDDTIERLYKDRHDANGHVGGIMACPNCPFVGAHVNETVLSSLLNGQDPDFSLPGRNAVQRGNQVVAGNGRVL